MWTSRCLPGIVGSAMLGMLTLSEVAPARDVVVQLAGHELADVLLCFLGGAADVRGQDHVRQAA